MTIPKFFQFQCTTKKVYKSTEIIALSKHYDNISARVNLRDYRLNVYKEFFVVVFQNHLLYLDPVYSRYQKNLIQ